MRDDDPFAPPAKQEGAPPGGLTPAMLDRMSVNELKAAIEGFKNDIAACEAMIAKKEGVRAAADALFSGGKPG